MSGLCPSCAEARAREEEQTQNNDASSFEASPPSGSTWLALAAGATVISAGILIAVVKAESRPLRSADDETIRVSQNDRTIVYRATERETHRGHIVTWQLAQGGTEGLGVVVALGYLDDDDYRTYRDEYQAKGRCAAAFLNSHLTMLLVVPARGNDETALRAATGVEGDTVELTGDVLEPMDYLVSGRSIPASFSFGNSTLIRPLKLAVSGKAVL